MTTTAEKSILVVDDSPTTARLIELQLNGLGYTVAGVADTADRALGLMQTARPDLVLMDINLGEGMDGIAAADIIMHRHGVPVVYVTSYSDDRTLSRAGDSMPFGFIIKPFRGNDLRVNIELALGRSTRAAKCRDTAPDAYAAAGGETKVQSTYLFEALDHLVSGVVMLDEELRIYYRNASANRILDAGMLLRARNECLICHSPRLRSDLQKHVRAKASVVFSAGDEDTTLHLLMFPLSHLPEAAAGSPRSILFMFSTLHDPGRLEDVVRTMYKLSPTEARIASRLVFRPYLAEVSGQLGITYNTARTHLKRIYQKTDTNKLPSLIQKIITGPAGLLIHYDSIGRGGRDMQRN